MSTSPEPPGPSRPQIALRTWAMVLVLCTGVPFLVFGGLTLTWMTRSQGESFSQTQMDTARVLASAVDGELHAWKAVLTALAQSQALQAGRLAEFYAEAKAVAAQHDGWIVLTALSGQQVLNTLRPYGTPLPLTGTPEAVRAVIATQRPLVGDLAFGKVAQRWIVFVAVPIFRNGDPAYMLDMAFTPDRLTRLLQRQQLPANWKLGIQDSQHQVVTRLPLSEERVGKPVPAWYMAALRTADQGMVTGTDVQGVPVRLAFHRLTEAPWTVSLDLPLAALPSPQPLYWFLALGALLAGVALIGAVLASRRLTRPVTALAAQAAQLLQGQVPERPKPTGIREITQLEQALVQAATSVQALHQEQTQRARAEERARAEAHSAAALRAEMAQRQQAEEAVRRAAEFHAATMDRLGEGLYTVDDTGLVSYMNPAAEELFGWSFAELRGQRMHDMTHHHYRDGRPFPIEECVGFQVKTTGQPLKNFEDVFIRKDGTFFDVSYSIAPLRDAAGKINGLVVVFSDITARKQAEAALRQQAEMLRLSYDAIIVWQVDGGIESWNRGAEELYGFAEAEAIGRVTDELLRTVHPVPWTDIAAQLQQTGNWEGELRHRARDGREVIVSARHQLVRGNDGVARVLETNRDITASQQAEAALQESEARFRTMADAIPQLAWIAQADGFITWYNRRWYEYTGTTPEQMEGWGWQSVHDPQELPRVLERWQASIATGQPFDMIFPLRGADGVFRPFLTRGMPLTDAQGRVQQWFGTNTDVTEQKQAEEALRHLTDDLERRVEQRTAELVTTNQELEAFTYSVSHDLRAPLRHITSFVALLDEEAAPRLDAQCRRYLQNVGEAAQRMGHLTDDLLMFSRIGRASLTVRPVSLARLVDEARAELAAATAGRTLEWQIEPLPEVSGDPVLLRSVVGNLLSNAIKFTRQREGARIEVGGYEQDGEVICFVRDNGAGFDMQFVDKLFGVFQRLHRLEDFEGTGIGLASVRRIIHRHGGRTWAEGAVGHGATFYFSLPARRDDG